MFYITCLTKSSIWADFWDKNWSIKHKIPYLALYTNIFIFTFAYASDLKLEYELICPVHLFHIVDLIIYTIIDWLKPYYEILSFFETDIKNTYASF